MLSVGLARTLVEELQALRGWNNNMWNVAHDALRFERDFFLLGEKILMKDFAIVRATLSQNFSFYSSRFFFCYRSSLPLPWLTLSASCRKSSKLFTQIPHILKHVKSLPQKTRLDPVCKQAALSPNLFRAVSWRKPHHREHFFFWGRFMRTAFHEDCSYIKICKEFGSS